MPVQENFWTLIRLALAGPQSPYTATATAFGWGIFKILQLAARPPC